MPVENFLLNTAFFTFLYVPLIAWFSAGYMFKYTHVRCAEFHSVYVTQKNTCFINVFRFAGNVGLHAVLTEKKTVFLLESNYQGVMTGLSPFISFLRLQPIPIKLLSCFSVCKRCQKRIQRMPGNVHIHCSPQSKNAT